jgi:hypothetical protein
MSHSPRLALWPCHEFVDLGGDVFRVALPLSVGRIGLRHLLRDVQACLVLLAGGDKVAGRHRDVAEPFVIDGQLAS